MAKNRREEQVKKIAEKMNELFKGKMEWKVAAGRNNLLLTIKVKEIGPGKAVISTVAEDRKGTYVQECIMRSLDTVYAEVSEVQNNLRTVLSRLSSALVRKGLKGSDEVP